MKLFVATHNTHKLAELSALLPGFELVADDPEVEETAPDFAGNALIKARAVARRHPGAWTLADDSGLCVNALDGAPGVHSARYAGESASTSRNNAKLLQALSDIRDRRAHFACCIALVAPDGTEHVLEGRCEGSILNAPAGVAGFGYDPLFVPEGYDRTFAELAPNEKNAISHRGRALERVRAFFASRESVSLPRVNPLNN